LTATRLVVNGTVQTMTTYGVVQVGRQDAVTESPGFGCARTVTKAGRVVVSECRVVAVAEGLVVHGPEIAERLEAPRLIDAEHPFDHREGQ
jgi:hypothetical protein